MENLAKTLGLETRIAFKGWADAETVADLLRAADVYFLPSRAEGLPIAVLEALACGTPVVATPVGDLGRVVRNGVNGFLTTSPSPEAFSEVLEQAIDRAWDRASISRSVASMRSSAVAQQIAALLNKAVNGAV